MSPISPISPGRFYGSAVAKRASSTPHSSRLWKDSLRSFCGSPEDIPLTWRRSGKSGARRGFPAPQAKRKSQQLLEEFQLDETAIEAEAVRCSSDQLEQLDRLLASLESRRNKALRCVAEYRGGLARQLRESSDRIIEGKGPQARTRAKQKTIGCSLTVASEGKSQRTGATRKRALALARASAKDGPAEMPTVTVLPRA